VVEEPALSTNCRSLIADAGEKVKILMVSVTGLFEFTGITTRGTIMEKITERIK
jgi:hypothetical protein